MAARSLRAHVSAVTGAERAGSGKFTAKPGNTVTSSRYCRWVRGVYDALELYITPEAGTRLGAGRYTNVEFADVPANAVDAAGSDGYARFDVTLDAERRCNTIVCWKREPTTTLVARRLIEAYGELRDATRRPFRTPHDTNDLLKDIHSQPH
jgi:hypothetical protein